MEGFIRMTVKLNKQPSECSLYEIRQFKESIEEEAVLESYAVYIEITGKGSVHVSLRIHEEVGWMVGVVLLTAEFRQDHLLTEVTVKMGIEMNLMEYLVRNGFWTGDLHLYIYAELQVILTLFPCVIRCNPAVFQGASGCLRKLPALKNCSFSLWSNEPQPIFLMHCLFMLH